MVVDDSAVVRGLLTRWLGSDPKIEVVATANNGEMALNLVSVAKPEIIILDIEMPKMDGLTALPKLLEKAPGVRVIMASTLTKRGADISIRALAAGAADYVPKPESTREAGAAETFRKTLTEKILVLGAAGRRRATPVKGRGATPAAGRAEVHSAGLYGDAPVTLRAPSRQKPSVIVIGSSTGGPQALFKVLTALSGKVSVPILVTQHMPATFTAILAEHIARVSGLPCAEATDGEVLRAGQVYVAPGEYHMTVVSKGAIPVIQLNQDPPENFCRPAVDQLFRGIARVYGNRALAAVLTGMGHDGLKGGEALVDAGGTLIAQDEDSSVVWGMPGAVATAGLCSAVLPIGKLGDELAHLATGAAQ